MSEGTNKDWPNVAQFLVIMPIFSILQQYVLIDYAQGKSHVVILQLPWFQRFKINLWLKAAIVSSSRANQFELGSDPESVS